MILYKITNKITGKRYIGQTIQELDLRWQQHCYKSEGCLYLVNAIKKYGKKNFEVLPISRCNTKEEMDDRERYYIKLYNTLAPNGYNLKSGGSLNSKPSAETRARMSIAQKKRANAPGQKEISSAISKAFHAADPGIAVRHGLKIKQRFKDNPEESDRQSLARGAKPFKAFDKNTGEIVWKGFNQVACEIALGVFQSNIWNCLKLKKKSCNGYIFRYVGEEDIVYVENTGEIKVVCLETGEIFDSVTIASEVLNVSRTGISKVCRLKGKSVGGMTFRYLGEESFIYPIKKSGPKGPTGPRISHKGSRRVLLIELNMTFDKIIDAVTFCVSQNRITRSSSIGNACAGRNKTAGGYTWKYIQYDNHK
jgi:group I intron endonuclease